VDKKQIRILKAMLLALFSIFSLLTWGLGIAIQSYIVKIDRILGFPSACLILFVQAVLYWRLGRQISRIDREAKDW